MPKITKVLTVEVTPEQFLENCSDNEIKELDLLLQSPRYQQRICNHEKTIGFTAIHSKCTKCETLIED